MSTEPQTSLHTYGDSVIVFETDTGRVVCGFDIRELLAIAAEKEAQQPKPTYKAPDYNRLKNLVAHFGNAVAEYVATKDKVPPNYPRSDLSLLEQIYAEIDSQHHPEQPLEMVAPADVPLLTTEEIDQVFTSCDVPIDRKVARAIESAVLRKNGWGSWRPANGNV